MNVRQKYWFWAWLVESTVAKDDLNNSDATCELWINLVIINAYDEVEAYSKAQEIGRSYEGDSKGTLTLHGRPATKIFLGVEDMGVIHDDLEDGAEILYRSKTCSQAEAIHLIEQKESLLAEVQRELSNRRLEG